MAVFRFARYAPGSGANSSSYFSMFSSYIASSATFNDTAMRGNPSAGERASLLGTDLTYTNLGGTLRVGGGNITSLGLVHNNLSIMSVTGFNFSGAQFGEAYYGGSSALEDFMTRGADKMYGTVENDYFYAGKGNDRVEGRDGSDYLAGEEGSDSIYGGTGNDTMDGNDGSNMYYGGAGNDTCYGGDGNEQAFGGVGGDYLNGYGGRDTFFGGTSDDSLYGGDSADKLYGGNDDDYVYGDDGNDQAFGGAGLDYLTGGSGEDRLDSGSGLDTIYGGNGDDTLLGGTGNDYLSGDADNDKIYSGLGTDSLYGGSGVDQFIFNTAPSDTNFDYISDFEVNIDKIVLDNDIFTAIGAVGAVVAARFRLGANATDANDRIIYDSATGDLFYDRDGNGSAAKIRIADLSSGLAMDADDFRIIG